MNRFRTKAEELAEFLSEMVDATGNHAEKFTPEIESALKEAFSAGYEKRREEEREEARESEEASK